LSGIEWASPRTVVIRVVPAKDADRREFCVRAHEAHDKNPESEPRVRYCKCFARPVPLDYQSYWGSTRNKEQTVPDGIKSLLYLPEYNVIS
jgi:hypothetical protein